MREFLSVVTPLLLHMILSELSVLFFGTWLDSTSCTAIAAAAVIPAAVWMYRKDRKAGRMGEDSGQKGNVFLFGVFCFAAGGLLNVAWSGILNLMRIGDHFSNQTQEALLAGSAVVQVLGLGILVPVAEELIFRGLIYNRMKGFLSIRQSVVLSSLLFAVYHGNPIQMIFAFPMALALTGVFERGKLFVFPVLFHMGANLTAVFMNFFL